MRVTKRCGWLDQNFEQEEVFPLHLNPFQKKMDCIFYTDQVFYCSIASKCDQK